MRPFSLLNMVILPLVTYGCNGNFSSLTENPSKKKIDEVLPDSKARVVLNSSEFDQTWEVATLDNKGLKIVFDSNALSDLTEITATLDNKTFNLSANQLLNGKYSLTFPVLYTDDYSADELTLNFIAASGATSEFSGDDFTMTESEQFQLDKLSEWGTFIIVE